MEMVLQMIGSPCYYCGEILETPGIKSVDSEAGFVEGNIKPCCTFCNKAKWNHHWQDFIRSMCNVGALSSDDTDSKPSYVFVDETTQRGSGDYNKNLYTCAKPQRSFRAFKK